MSKREKRKQPPQDKSAGISRRKDTGAGAHGDEAAVERAASTQQPPASVQPVEPEDAYLTGASRSLQRRLLGLNVGDVRAGARKPHTASDDTP